MTSYEFERALVYLAEQIIKTFGEDVGAQEPVERDLEKTRSTGEPLIKDEKIRKAVRAWAEAWGFDRVYAYDDDHTNTTRLENGNEGVGIEIDNSTCKPLRRNKCYTIAELCGEEEK